MKELLLLLVHLLTAVARLLGPDGAKALVAENLLIEHQLLVLTHKRRGKPRPKGPSQELIRAIVELKRRNPRFGCPRIALIIARTFGVEIDKDVVRRVLAKHYRPEPGAGGPSSLTFIGHAKDSLWSVDLFRCESIMLRTH